MPLRALPVQVSLVFACSLVLAIGCGPAPTSKFPPQEAGCAVAVFHDAPKVQSENIGTVSARCDESVANEDCLRTLQDEVCKAGGDVVWGVPERPSVAGGKKHYEGRAARALKKAPRPPVSPAPAL